MLSEMNPNPAQDLDRQVLDVDLDPDTDLPKLCRSEPDPILAAV
jgi:hypothetical protein